MDNDAVSLDAAQTSAAVAANGSVLDKTRGTVTNNPVLGAAAKTEKLINELPDKPSQMRAARLIVEELQARGLVE